MASKIKVDQIQTGDGTGTIALQNQLSGMTTASLPTVTTDKLGTGAVLQVVSSLFNSDVSTTSTAWTDTGHSVSITPSSTSNKIFAQLSGGGIGTSAAGGWVKLDLFRGSTGLSGTSVGLSTLYNSGGAIYSNHSLSFLDSPSSTSALTYKLYIKSNHSSNTSYYHWSDRGKCVLTLMEIAG